MCSLAIISLVADFRGGGTVAGAGGPGGGVPGLEQVLLRLRNAVLQRNLGDPTPVCNHSFLITPLIDPKQDAPKP